MAKPLSSFNWTANPYDELRPSGSIVVPRWNECTAEKNGDSCFEISTRKPSYVSTLVMRRASHVAASRGPGFTQADAVAAARAMASSPPPVETSGAGGRSAVVDSGRGATAGGGGVEPPAEAEGGGSIGGDAEVSPLPPTGGRGGGAGGASHLDEKKGKRAEMVMLY